VCEHYRENVCARQGEDGEREISLVKTTGFRHPRRCFSCVLRLQSMAPAHAAKSFMASHLIVFLANCCSILGKQIKNLAFRQMTRRKRNFNECSVCANYKVVKREFGYLHTTAIAERAQEKLSDSHSATGPRVTNQNSSSYSLGEESLNARC
jgi:hypothetical protein